MAFNTAQALQLARDTLDIEAQALLGLKDRLDERFAQAVKLMLHVQGRVVVTGMGKSGHIGRKIAATLASTAGLKLFYGTLNWNNFGHNPSGAPSPTRVAATNAVTMRGGNLTVNGAGSTDTVVTLNTITSESGNNFLGVYPYVNEGSTVKVTIGNLVRNASSRSGFTVSGWSVNNSTGSNTLDFGNNAYTYVDSGAQRVFTIGSATVTVTRLTTAIATNLKARAWYSPASIRISAWSK